MFLVPDDVVIDLVRERLNKLDCRLNGWILDGCPTNEEQIARLKDLGFKPQLVVALELNDTLVYERIESRRFDPVDGKYYNIARDTFPAHKEKEMHARLIHQVEHTRPHVQQKLQEYTNFLATVEDEYRKHLIRISAEDSPEKVF